MKANPRLLFFSLLVTSYSLLTSCGFHLRGTGSVRLPESLATLRVAVQGSQAAHDPLRLAMQEALRNQAGARVETTGELPTLILLNENTDTQVLTVGAAGKVSEYLVRYEISFGATDAQGRKLFEEQTIRLQRQYNFDPLNVLAKEQEEENLKRELRRDALAQIVRRLARIKLPAESSK